MLQKYLILLFGSALLFAGVQYLSNGKKETPAPDVTAKVQQVNYTNITSAELKQMLAGNDFFFANVHTPYEGEIEKTDAFIPYDQIENNVDQLPKDKSAKIVLYCRSGRMSKIAAEKLVAAGYTNVYNLTGGMIEWEGEEYPLIVRPQ